MQTSPTRLGAAVAYYTIFSLAPLLVVVIAVAGRVLGEKAVQGDIVGQIAGLVGQNAAEMIQTMIADAGKPRAGLIATVIGVVTLLVGTTGLFGEFQDDPNTIWKIAAEPHGIVATVRTRFIGFLIVLGIAVLLLVSLAVTTGVAALGHAVGSGPLAFGHTVPVVTFMVSLGIGTVLFAMIYKVLPDAEIAWRDVWVGAAVTSLLFTIGQLLIGLYVGYSGTALAYGAAGSLVILLFWVFYSAQILFFGAEFTQVVRQSLRTPRAPDRWCDVSRAIPSDEIVMTGPLRSSTFSLWDWNSMASWLVTSLPETTANDTAAPSSAADF